MAAAGEAAKPRVVICGGGIIGAATAYYLARKGGPEVASRVTVVEREAPACAASGKAGGFLALDWNDNSPVGPLARLSYGLHPRLAADLAAELGERDVGYRAVHTWQVVGVEAVPAGVKGGRLKGSDALPAWIDGNVLGSSEMGDTESTAQVHPALLTRALLDSAVAAGARLVTGCVQGLQLEAAPAAAAAAAGQEGKRVTGVVVDGQVLPADVAVVAMGPWSDAARAWLEGVAEPGAVPRITGQKYHSVVLRPDQPVTNHMLFTGFKYTTGRTVEPEVYPRPDGTVYVCGEPQALPVPPSPAEVTVEAELIDNIRRVAGSLASCLKQAPVEAQQACYLPCAPDSLPVIGPVPGAAGVYLATGHTCWGILNAPATGLVMAEMILEGKAKIVDVQPFAPARFVRGAAAGAVARR
ncbi:hypothetical protein HYH02_003809 [Chlamydomonas schloesseri]|uniref:FAD dependent oxidoreductase domain-containing protein n=1 Tax=Chlamydomonas schloesseri TaxID=2026947 RepID=A0A835WPP5_9CHLO|nr:hypothetical protein HYH02_003809 [Chlamydomonas schloesseri]|eukprot:KAG2451202.1 hypothetical protein HYH02_003809 [Chlamydomonas schloesseri]